MIRKQTVGLNCIVFSGEPRLQQSQQETMLVPINMTFIIVYTKEINAPIGFPLFPAT
jgi:hypothetical protein